MKNSNLSLLLLINTITYLSITGCSTKPYLKMIDIDRSQYIHNSMFTEEAKRILKNSKLCNGKWTIDSVSENGFSYGYNGTVGHYIPGPWSGAGDGTTRGYFKGGSNWYEEKWIKKGEIDFDSVTKISLTEYKNDQRCVYLHVSFSKDIAIHSANDQLLTALFTLCPNANK